VLWIVLICVAVLLYVVVKSGRGTPEQQFSFTDFMNQVEKGNVKQVAISGTDVKGTLADQTKFHTLAPVNYTDYYKTLREKNVNLEFHEASSGTIFRY